MVFTESRKATIGSIRTDTRKTLVTPAESRLGRATTVAQVDDGTTHILTHPCIQSHTHTHTHTHIHYYNQLSVNRKHLI